MIWGIYKHKMRFEHNVPDADWLEDKACIKSHKHGRTPNPLCVVEFIVATEKPLYFKVIKKHAIASLNVIANKVIKEEQEGDDGTLIVPFEYDFGTTTTETLVADLRKLMLIALKEFKPIRIQIWLDETRKYSVWDDGEAPEISPDVHASSLKNCHIPESCSITKSAHND